MSCQHDACQVSCVSVLADAGSCLRSASTHASNMTAVDLTATGVIVNKHFLNVTYRTFKCINSNCSTLLIFILIEIKVYYVVLLNYFFTIPPEKGSKLWELQIAAKSRRCIFLPLLWRRCFSPAAPRPLERFITWNSAYTSHIRWYFGRN